MCKGPRGRLVKFDEQIEVATREEPRRRAAGSPAVLPAEDFEVARERRPLESYFQEIGGTRTLKREEEVQLAKELEAATAALRNSLYAIPLCARHVVTRWDALRALSHTGAKLSESAGDEETGEIAQRVERAVQRLRRHLKNRDAIAEADGKPAALKRVDAAVIRDLEAAQLSLALLSELRARIVRHAKEFRAARKSTR